MSREIRAYAGNRRVSTAVILSDGTLLQVYPRKNRKCISFEEKDEWFEQIWDKYDDAVFVTEGPTNFDVVLYEQREEEPETKPVVSAACMTLLWSLVYFLVGLYIYLLLKIEFPDTFEQLSQLKL
jgi:hypothetical protein